MNIHFAYVDGSPRRLTSNEAKRIGLTFRSSKGTEPARTRTGQIYPGGKQLRSALKRLSLRRALHELGSKDGHTMPGSMAR